MYCKSKPTGLTVFVLKREGKKHKQIQQVQFPLTSHSTRRGPHRGQSGLHCFQMDTFAVNTHTHTHIQSCFQPNKWVFFYEDNEVEVSSLSHGLKKHKWKDTVHYDLPSCLVSNNTSKSTANPVILVPYFLPTLTTVMLSKLRKLTTSNSKPKREEIERTTRKHLLQSSFHERVVQVKVNISSHSSSPLTVSICPAVDLFVDQSQRDHTLTCLELHSTPTMVFIPQPERRGGKEGEAGRWGVSELEVREKMPADYLGI